MRALTALLCAMLLIISPAARCAAEAAVPLPTASVPLPTEAPAVASAPAETPVPTPPVLSDAETAPTEGRELSGYYGGDIAQAAEELGGLTFSASEEYSENYDGPTLTLRGQNGRVTMIELKDAPGGDSLCGVTIGMPRAEVEALMAGCPMLWQYDEEVAFTIRADAENELNSETLVVFLSEEGRVNGAWYRAGN